MQQMGLNEAQTRMSMARVRIKGWRMRNVYFLASGIDEGEWGMMKDLTGRENKKQERVR